MPHPNAPRNHRRNRRGFTLVLALLCLVVTSMLVANLLRIIRLEQQQRVNYANALQADWLARYALERAANQFAADPSYRGETWDVVLPGKPVDKFAAANPIGRLEITLPEDQPISVTVVVRYPVDQPHEITKSLTKPFPGLTSISE